MVLCLNVAWDLCSLKMSHLIIQLMSIFSFDVANALDFEVYAHPNVICFNLFFLILMLLLDYYLIQADFT